MAVAVAQKKVLNLGSVKGVISTLTFDSSYPADGEVISALVFGLTEIAGFVPLMRTKGYNFEWDEAAGKMKVFDGSTEVADATDLSTLVVDILALGT
jgi:hypothetical protein